VTRQRKQKKGRKGVGQSVALGSLLARGNMTGEGVCFVIFILKIVTFVSNAVPPIIILLLSFHYITACSKFSLLLFVFKCWFPCWEVYIST
jgi:hypothetical protein